MTSQMLKNQEAYAKEQKIEISQEVKNFSILPKVKKARVVINRLGRTGLFIF